MGRCAIEIHRELRIPSTEKSQYRVVVVARHCTASALLSHILNFLCEQTVKQLCVSAAVDDWIFLSPSLFSHTLVYNT